MATTKQRQQQARQARQSLKADTHHQAISTAADMITTLTFRVCAQAGWTFGYTCTEQAADSLRQIIQSIRQDTDARIFTDVRRLLMLRRDARERELIKQYGIDEDKFKSMEPESEIAKLPVVDQYSLGVVDLLIGQMTFQLVRVSYGQ